MPRKFYEDEAEASDESVDYVHEEEEELPEVDIDAEIQKARDSMKNKKLKKQEEELAKQLKRERLAKQKEYPPPPKKSGRYEKGSDEAKQWAKKMQDARRAKKEARESENKRQEEREVLTKTKLEEAQEAKILALQRQIDQFKAEASTPIEVPEPQPPKVKRQYTKRKPKVTPETPVQTETETETETETDLEEFQKFKEAKKRLAKKKQTQKAVAQQHIEDERQRIEDELYLQQMRSVIPTFKM